MTPTDCTACPLHLTAKRAVGVDGPAQAEWMILGEAPGQMEEYYGMPFRGPSGRLLNKLLEVAGLRRADVVTDNVVRHRPPGNRTPTVKEAEACSVWTEATIRRVRPRVVVTVGATALRLLAPSLALMREHGVGRLWEWRRSEFVLVPWYHPAAVLRNPPLMAVLVEDARRVRRMVEWVERPPVSATYSALEEGEVDAWLRHRDDRS